jgi:hypothetical protein
MANLPGDCTEPRPELGQGIALENLPWWDFGIYMSMISNTLMVDGTGTGTLERACVVGGKIVGGMDARSSRRRRPTTTPPTPTTRMVSALGGEIDSKLETKKASNWAPDPKRPDGFVSKWSNAAQKLLDQRQQALKLTGEEHTAQHTEEQLQHNPAEGFLEGLGAGGFGGYKLDYTDGVNADADMDAIGQAAKQKEVVDAKSRNKKVRYSTANETAAATQEASSNSSGASSTTRLSNRELGSCTGSALRPPSLASGVDCGLG